MNGSFVFSGAALLLPVAPDATSSATIAPRTTIAVERGLRFILVPPFVDRAAAGAAPPGRGAAPTGRALLGVSTCRVASLARERVDHEDSLDRCVDAGESRASRQRT